MEAQSEWSNTYANLKRIHDIAYKIIDEAITLEEKEKPLEVVLLL